MHALAMFFAFVGGAIGYYASGIGAALIGVVIGAIVGMVAAAKSGAAKTNPPVVRLAAEQEPQRSDQAAVDIAWRLEKLEALKSKGLISEAEFHAKRQGILEEL